MLSDDEAVLLGKTLLRLLSGSTGAQVAIRLAEENDVARREIVRDAVRAAILEHVRELRPSATEAGVRAIKRTLLEWGVSEDAGVLADVVVKELEGGLTPEKLQAWSDDVAAAQARRELVDALATPRIGTRVRMTKADRGRVQTGTLGALIGVNAKLAAGRDEVMEFAYGGDAYEMIFRRGFDGEGSAEGSFPLVGILNGILKIGPFAGLRAAGHRLGDGVTLRFTSPAEEQRVADRLLRNGKIDFDDLAEADNIMLVRERLGALDGTGGIQAVLNPANAEFGTDGADKIGLVAGVRALVGAGVQGVISVAENNKGSVRRSEGAVSGKAGATASTGTLIGANEQDQHDRVVLSAAEAGVAVAEIGKRKAKLVTGPDGLVMRGTEKMRQAFGLKAFEAIQRLRGPEFDRAMALLQQQQPQVHAAIQTIVADHRTNEMASVAWVLDPNAGAYAANTHRMSSLAVRDHRAGAGILAKPALISRHPRGDEALARRLWRKGDDVLANDVSYNFGRVATVSVKDQSETKTHFDIGIAAAATTNSVAAESIPAEVRLVVGELLKIVATARREALYGVRTEGSR
jgi:hypothetical protein